jgi:hypothetical protein
VLRGVHCSTKYGSLARGLKPPAAGYSDLEDCIVCQPDSHGASATTGVCMIVDIVDDDW